MGTADSVVDELNHAARIEQEPDIDSDEAAVEAVPCPVCAETMGRQLWPLPEQSRSVMKCDECGLTFIWPRVEQDFGATPESHFYDDWRLLDDLDFSWLYWHVSTTARRGGLINPETIARDNPAILDVGCGAGHVLPHFRAHGWRVSGVDPWAAVTAIGRKYYRVPIETSRMETADVAPRSQHVVLSIDVLQFVADPKAFLAACLAALRPGGLFYATVPNYDSAARRRANWTGRNFLPFTYLSYFNAATLTRLARRAGFERIEVELCGAEGDEHLRLLARRPMETPLTWSDLASEVDDDDLPPLDRTRIDEARLTAEQRHWREHGYLIRRNLIPHELIDRYCRLRERVVGPHGWAHETPYMEVPEIRDLCLHPPLMETLEHLIGEPVGMHLNLTGWVSTDRDWHQDDYLNPPEINGHYVAVWFALDTIQPDSGPFEFLPGSHRWPLIRQSRILSLLGQDGSDPSWPHKSEQLLTPFFECEIARRNLEVARFLGNKGDVLIWHARLAHRGSLAERPGAERRAIITHYSALSRRSDMPVVRRHPGGGHYFELSGEGGAGGLADEWRFWRAFKRLLPKSQERPNQA